MTHTMVTNPVGSAPRHRSAACPQAADAQQAGRPGAPVSGLVADYRIDDRVMFPGPCRKGVCADMACVCGVPDPDVRRALALVIEKHTQSPMGLCSCGTGEWERCEYVQITAEVRQAAGESWFRRP